MRIGYARVSTGEQKMDPQIDVLEEAGCERIYEETTSGAAKSRSALEKCIGSLRDGDTLVVWRLDGFGRSLKDLVSKMETLEEKGADFVSVTEGIDTTTAQGKLTSRVLRCARRIRAGAGPGTGGGGPEAARERGRVGGRPRALSEEDIPQLQALMKDPDVPTADICERFGVSKATLCRAPLHGYVGPNGERRR
jgi:DNA invertase Pin-like site-specific DNA recombinase